MFLGHPCSGHSLIGGLLDAHPDAVVAHEAGALRYLTARYDRLRLYQVLLENAAASATAGRPSGEYRYAVPGQWQGRSRRILVIGDKQAEGATLRLRARPWLLERLRRTVRVPLRLIHVIRNPFDTIATIARRAAAGPYSPDLEVAMRRYFSLCATVDEIRPRLHEGELYELRHEEFVAAPSRGLARLCAWLGLDPASDYLAACRKTVRPTPRRSREAVRWSPALLAEVGARMQAHPHLAGYRFDG